MSRPPSDSEKRGNERTGDWGRCARLNERPRALFLAAEAPYPMIGGGPTRAASVLEFLAQHFRVHGVFFREPGAANPAEAIPKGHLDRADVIDLPFHSKSALARIQRNAVRLVRNRPPLIDRFAGFEAEVERCVSGQQYEAALIEQFWCAPYLEQIRKRASRVILDVYNVESVWHHRVAEFEHGLLAWSHNRFGRASLEQERHWLPRFDGILATSCHDARLMQAIALDARMIVYPNALPLIPAPPRGERHEIVFSGNLEYAPNLSAVQFFHREIWPSLRPRWPELKWVILGKNPGSFVRELAARDSNIEVTGFVDDALGAIAQAQVAIVPLLAGSGTRIKILEAWAAATPVVSTTLGAEGLEFQDGEHLLTADDAESFTAAVSKLLASSKDRERIGAAGRRLYEERYTWPSAWKALERALDIK